MDIKIKKGKQGNFNATIGSTMVTPIALVVSSWLDKPYVAEDGKASYNIVLGFKPDDPYLAELEKAIGPGWEEFVKQTKLPDGHRFKIAKEDEKNPGMMLLRFATSAKQENGIFPPFPDVYDRLRKKCAAPWKGSKVRVSFTPSGWKTGMGNGVKLYLNGVLVVDGVFGRSASSDFEAFYEAPTGETEVSGDDIPDASSFA